MSIWSDMSIIVSATLSGDITFKTVQAYRSEAAWFVFGPLTILGAIAFYYRERFAERLEKRLGYSATKITHPIISSLLLLGMCAAFLPPINALLGTLTLGLLPILVVFGPIVLIMFERTPVIYCYIIMASIIFIGVIQRFVFSVQVPWSTTIPPLLFMIMAWFGATFNIRLRTHLSFSEFRTKYGPRGQLFWLTFDNALWLVFCIICVTTMSRVTVNTYDNFAIVLGTDNTMRWWFLATMPVCFILLATRAFENVVEDFANYKSGKPLIKQAVIGGDV